MVGKTLSHYKILSEISRGGMGIVYRALDTKLDREVAIKVLPPELVSDAERRRRFVQEAKAAAALHHPHIATVFEIDEADGVTFIAMELIEGEKLRDVLQQERLPVARTLELVTEVAEGLALAHEKGVVHRDLKPANVMVTKQGHAKIIDFGLAKLVEPLGGSDAEATTAARAETDPGKVMGTLSYMSPEQARGSRVDHRSDIFSLGVVLHEMLTGQPPFQGATGADTFTAILKDPVPRLPALGAEVSPEAASDLQRAIDKCLAKDPGKRYHTMGDVVVDLRALWRRVESGSTASVAVPVVSGAKRMLALAIAGAAVAVVAGYLLLSRQPTSTEKVTPAAQRKKIAVLPFENLGPPEDAYFADGMTEEITSRLAGVSGLGVISRNSATQYKDTDKPTQQIGDELGIEYLLEGTVRWQKGSDGNPGRVRVTPQLIRVSDDTQLWSDVYERVTDDLFEVQTEIAQQVIQQLDVTLLAPEREALTSKPTENMEAFEAYQRGRGYLFGASNASKDELELAEQMFDRAVRLDPNFAEAYARLATAHIWMWFHGHDRSEERLERARETLERARELQPDLPAVHQSSGLYTYMVERDYDRALSELSIAAKRLPNDAITAVLVAAVHRRRGDWEQAIGEMEAALELDPRNALVAGQLGITYSAFRRYSEADRLLSLAISVAPDYGTAYWFKALNVWTWKGETAEARRILEEMPYRTDAAPLVWSWFTQETLERNFDAALSRLESSPLASLEGQHWGIPKVLLSALTFRRLDRTENARAAFEGALVILEPRVPQSPEDHRFHSALGITYAGLGRKEEAVAAGKRGVELMPVSKDALMGPWRIDDLALIYTMVGEYEAALEQIDRVLSVPSHFSVPLLELDPKWDPLRDHPRYQELIEKHR